MLLFPGCNQEALQVLNKRGFHMMPSIQFGLYEHYKGKHYSVFALSRHSETLEDLVVYQALYGDYGIWVRPLDMFQEEIIVDGKARPRFKFIRSILS